MTGGAAEADKSRCPVGETARHVGGDGCTWIGSRTVRLLKAYDWTVFCSDVVKKRRSEVSS